MEKHFNIKITGKVQGVFFRASTKEQADRLDIKGFVRNEPDGSVYIEAEGRNLEPFVHWCEKGPPHAVVERCEIAEAEWKGFDRFIVRR